MSAVPSAAVRSPASMPTLRLTDDRFEVAGRHVYLIGIAGSGMSGLAQMLAARGAIVSGSDLAPSETTAALEAAGIAVGFDQTRAWLPDRCDLVVASAAVRADHPQAIEASRRGVHQMLYAEALGRCMVGRTGVAVAGTHGKSTTTAMLGCALAAAGLDPTVIVGATCAQLSPEGRPTGVRMGAAEIPAGGMAGSPGLLVAEACEFNRSFHNFRPLLASISSVEADHLDVYGTFDAVIESFRAFAALLPAAADGGKLLIAHDGACRVQVTAGVACEVRTIGFSPDADHRVEYDVATRTARLTHARENVATWRMTLPGAHNALNAATALTLATWLGADPAVAAAALGDFCGVDRRMQLLGERPVAGGSVRVFDDYAHHPTAIDTTLRALREAERPQDRGGRLICVFQPHQHSRTRHLMEEFAASFSQADVVIVPDIYFVRDSEEERHLVTAGHLVDRLRERGLDAMHLYPFEAVVQRLGELCRPGDVVVAMGAGPVWQVARGYLDQP